MKSSYCASEKSVINNEPEQEMLCIICGASTVENNCGESRVVCAFILYGTALFLKDYCA